jgi:flagellar biosynthesis protein FlhB
MAEDKDNRTERPTRRKLDDARKEGQVARSREVPLSAVLLGCVILLYYFGQEFLRNLESEMRSMLSFRLPSELTVEYLSHVFNVSVLHVSSVVMPVLLTALFLSITSNIAQGGMLFSMKPLGLHFNKLSPKNGLNRILSKNGLMELAKGLVLLSVVSFICYQVMSDYIPLYPRLVLMDAKKLIYWTASISYEILIKVSILFVIVAIADYYFQKYRHIERLKMTKQEVKEEYKNLEGDPLIKARIRRIQREMARKRMMTDVSTADVIITNPTHYAVALSYKLESMEAPKVVAKGVGFLAQRIKELAQEHGIPLVENKPLAQTLYKTVEVGEYIPGNLYKAVAEILAYVYKAKNILSR